MWKIILASQADTGNIFININTSNFYFTFINTAQQSHFPLFLRFVLCIGLHNYFFCLHNYFKTLKTRMAPSFSTNFPNFNKVFHIIY